jgi:hypothetical protein
VTRPRWFDLFFPILPGFQTAAIPLTVTYRRGQISRI